MNLRVHVYVATDPSISDKLYLTHIYMANTVETVVVGDKTVVRIRCNDYYIDINDAALVHAYSESDKFLGAWRVQSNGVKCYKSIKSPELVNREIANFRQKVNKECKPSF